MTFIAFALSFGSQTNESCPLVFVVSILNRVSIKHTASTARHCDVIAKIDDTCATRCVVRAGTVRRVPTIAALVKLHK